MEMRERLALAAFTTLVQAGAGLAIATRLLAVPDPAGRFAQAVALGLTAAGLALAFTHLGRPSGAWRVAANLGSSWLSRECVLLGALAGLLGADLLLRPLPGTRAMAALAGWLAVPVAALGLVSMAWIYRRTAMPAWRAAHTPVAFLASAAMLGAAGLAVIAGAALNRPARLQVPLAAAIILQLGHLATHLYTLGKGGAAGRLSLRRMAGLPLVAGAALTLVGGAVLLPLIGTPAAPAAWAALAALALGQAGMRYAFYHSGVHAMGAGWADIRYRPAARHSRIGSGSR
jgi:anaerobic dimethyl sulfoxide reductase subunit C (anchor subunit)